MSISSIENIVIHIDRVWAAFNADIVGEKVKDNVRYLVWKRLLAFHYVNSLTIVAYIALDNRYKLGATIEANSTIAIVLHS